MPLRRALLALLEMDFTTQREEFDRGSSLVQGARKRVRAPDEEGSMLRVEREIALHRTV